MCASKQGADCETRVVRPGAGMRTGAWNEGEREPTVGGDAAPDDARRSFEAAPFEMSQERDDCRRPVSGCLENCLAVQGCA